MLNSKVKIEIIRLPIWSYNTFLVTIAVFHKI